MNKPKVAAISGVISYLEEESKAGAPSSPAEPSPWALYGRQSIMRMRELVQRRIVRR